MRSLARQIGLAVAVLGLVAGAQAPTRADLMFDFSYDFANNPGAYDFTASGVLTTTDVLNPDGSYTITGITGTRSANGETDNITGLVAPGGFGSNDNELFANGGLLLDDYGFTFTISSSTNGDVGTNQVNVFYDTAYSENSIYVGIGSFDVSLISTVPEPSSLAMCGLAVVIGLGVARVRRKRA